MSDRIRDGFARIASALRADEWGAAESVGLTPTQLAILSFLDGRDGPGVRVGEVATQLRVTQPTATDSINALERKGYLTKQSAESDRRATLARITGDGRDAFARAMGVRGAVAGAVAALSPAEQEATLMVLVRVIRGLQEAGAIPIQRMCATCRYFRPHAHPGAAAPHHCDFVNAAFGDRDFRIDCRDHQTADPADRAATWTRFQTG